MKKVIAAALSAAVLGGSLFAIDFGNGLVLDGVVYTGIRVESADDGDDNTTDTTVNVYNYDQVDGNATRAQLTFAYTTDLFGAKVRLRDDIQDGKGTFVGQYAYAWANLFDNKATVYAGRIGPAADIWGNGVASNTLVDRNNEDRYGNAARLEFKLIDNLSFGTVFALPTNGQPIDDWLGDFGFGAKYTTDTIKAVASVGFTHKDHAVIDDDRKTTSDGNVNLLFALKGIFDPLTVAVEGHLFTAGDIDTDTTPVKTGNKGDGYFEIGPVVTFALGDTIELHAQGLYSTSSNIYSEGGAIGPDGASIIDPDLAADDKKLTSTSFEVGADFALDDSLNVFFNVGSENVAYTKGNGFFVQPGLKKVLSPNATIILWDKINRLGADDLIRNPGPNEKSYSPVTNTLQLDFNFKF